MATRKYKKRLSQTSLEELQKELKDLAEALNKGTEETTKKLGQKSLEYMKKQYSENKMNGHIGNIDLKSYKKRYKNGFVISSGNDEVAIYNEFGTGIVGEGTNPLADEAGYEYNMNSPYKGEVPEMAVIDYLNSITKEEFSSEEEYEFAYENAKKQLQKETTPNTWWYYKNGSWKHTEGMKGKNMYSSLVEELRENAGKEYKTAISQTIGNYNSGR